MFTIAKWFVMAIVFTFGVIFALSFFGPLLLIAAVGCMFYAIFMVIWTIIKMFRK
jgi:hypothetical protein